MTSPSPADQGRAMLAAIKERHAPERGSRFCWCGNVFPCDTARLVEAVEVYRAFLVAFEYEYAADDILAAALLAGERA